MMLTLRAGASGGAYTSGGLLNRQPSLSSRAVAQ